MVSVAERRTPGVLDHRRDSRGGSTALDLGRAGRVVRSALGEPPGIVERTRWLFAMLAVTVLELVVLPAVVLGGSDEWAGAVGATAVLWTSWVFGYRRRRSPMLMDLVDAVALAGLAVFAPTNGAVTWVIFAAVLFRSQYGSAQRSFARAALFTGALSAIVVLWPMVPGHGGTSAVSSLLTSVPVILLAAMIGSHLAGSVRAREHLALLEGVLGTMGARLLGTTDADAIREIAWVALDRISEVTPGLVVIKITAGADGLSVEHATSGVVVPAVLPADLESALERGDSACDRSPEAHAALDAAAGGPHAWVCLPLAEANQTVGRTWFLVGAPNRVPPAALTAVRNLANQVTLAMRNSAVHRDLTVLAEVDGATGLANRAAFDAAVARDQQGVALRETSVLFVDLDDFKDVNDVHGHRAGDDLLRVVADRLHEATRPGDLCARIGGDEFAVLLGRTSAAAASAVAQRVVEAVSTPVTLPDATVNVSASVGVATVVGGDDPETLVHRADLAMYAAKAQGKGRVQVFESDLLDRDPSWVVFERDLAAAAGNGQLVVHYQPVVSTSDGRCTAVEALVRWQHPRRGLLQPGTFIEVAERTGAIGSIGVAVLRQDVTDTATWQHDHPRTVLPVHVNVSALQLDDDTFALAVADCLRDAGLPADRLVLELTESRLISSPQAIVRLHAMAASGVQIAIDDFGTGYASLTTLRTLPAQVVKIDKSFVAGCTTNIEDRAVIEGVVAMADRIGLRVIAEGVERPEQRALLLSMGVREAQGFLYLSPQPVAGLLSWLAERPPVADARVDRILIPFTPRHSA